MIFLRQYGTSPCWSKKTRDILVHEHGSLWKKNRRMFFCKHVPGSLFYHSAMHNNWIVQVASLKYGNCHGCDLLIRVIPTHGLSKSFEPSCESCSQDLAWDDCQGHHRAAYPNSLVIHKCRHCGTWDPSNSWISSGCEWSEGSVCYFLGWDCEGSPLNPCQLTFWSI